MDDSSSVKIETVIRSTSHLNNIDLKMMKWTYSVGKDGALKQIHVHQVTYYQKGDANGVLNKQILCVEIVSTEFEFPVLEMLKFLS